MKRPEWAPSTDEELHDLDLVIYWQNHAGEWRDYATYLESQIKGENENVRD